MLMSWNGTMANTIHQPLIALGRIGIKRGLRPLVDALWNLVEHGVECFTGIEFSLLVVLEALTGIALPDAAAYALFPVGTFEGLSDLRFHLKMSLGINLADEDVRKVAFARFYLTAKQLVVRA
jgi:hypothetical protein